MRLAITDPTSGQLVRVEHAPAHRVPVLDAPVAPDILLEAARRVEAHADDLALQMAVEIGVPVRWGIPALVRAASGCRRVVEEEASPEAVWELALNPWRSLPRVAAALVGGTGATVGVRPQAWAVGLELVAWLRDAGVPDGAVTLELRTRSVRRARPPSVWGTSTASEIVRAACDPALRDRRSGRVQVQEGRLATRCRALAEAAEAVCLGDPRDPETTLGPLPHHAARDALHATLTDAVRGGAHLVCGGVVPDGPGAFYPLTVLTRVPAEHPLWREDVDGPVVVLREA